MTPVKSLGFIYATLKVIYRYATGKFFCPTFGKLQHISRAVCPVPDVSYNVFGGTLSLTQSIDQSRAVLRKI